MPKIEDTQSLISTTETVDHPPPSLRAAGHRETEETTMTPTELKEARKELGLTQSQMGSVLNLGKNGDVTVRRWELGERDPSGPVLLMYRELLAGWRPSTWISGK